MRPRRRPAGSGGSLRRVPRRSKRFLPADGPSFNPPFPGKQAPRPRRRALRLPAGLLRGRCHRAFNVFSNETCLTSALHRLVAIAQKELKSERGALFRRDEDNRLACVAAVNLTDMELKSEQMRPCLEWLDGFSDRPAAPGRGEQGLCLPLDIGESGLWLLYLDSTFTDGSFAHLHQPELHTLSYLFASEVRSALRLKKCATRSRGTRRSASSPSCSKRTETLPPCSEPASGAARTGQARERDGRARAHSGGNRRREGGHGPADPPHEPPERAFHRGSPREHPGTPFRERVLRP